MTVVMVAREGAAVAALGVRDELRAEAPEAVDCLRASRAPGSGPAPAAGRAYGAR